MIKVVDGDTITIRTSENEKIRVRLTGIDAPESDQLFGKASKEKLASFIANKDVRIETNKSDRNGRVLAKVWVQPSDCATCGKTLNVNHAQILAGMAWGYRRDAKELSDDAKEWVHRRLRYGWVIVGKLFVTDYAIEPFDV